MEEELPTLDPTSTNQIAKSTPMVVFELKKDPISNSEFVHAVSDATRWGSAKKITFLAPVGTSKIGDILQVTIDFPQIHEPKSVKRMITEKR